MPIAWVRRWTSLFLLLLVASCAGGHGSAPVGAPGGSANPQDHFLVGAAARRITPSLEHPAQPIYIAGLDRGLEVTKVHDDLFARALVVTDPDGVSVGLVVLDLIGFFYDDVEVIREELRRTHPEIALTHLAVTSTHTHAGPDVIGLWTPIGGSVDAAYVAGVRSEAVEALVEAWRGRRPAQAFIGQSTAPGLSKDTRLPELTDDLVMVVGYRSLDGAEGIASLVNWNSHPSVTGGGNSELSADFPGAVIKKMERDWGGVALYASGDLGGQIGSGRVKLVDPATGRTADDRMTRLELLGERIAQIALDALDPAHRQAQDAKARIRVKTRSLFVPMDNPRFAQGLAIGLIRPRRLYPLSGEGSGWLPSELPDPSSLRAGAYSLKTEVGVVDLGAARLVLIPGELYPELALGKFQDPQDPGADFQGAAKEPALRPLSVRPVFLLCLANDELGYIIPKSQWDSEPPYAYNRDEPQYGERNSVGPQAAPILLEALAQILSEM